MRFISTLSSVAALATTVLSAPYITDLSSRADYATITGMELPSSALPPPTGLSLRWVGLGIGTQNYTCASSTSADKPVSNGAKASLYDISGLAKERKEIQELKIKTLPAIALGAYPWGEQAVKMTLTMMGANQVLGNHFFNTTLTPCFFLSSVKNTPFPELFAKKMNNTGAPENSCPGTKGEGAIDWLFLSDVGESVGGVKAVYRVMTAGGKQPADCNGQQKEINVPYAAEYWFYG